jgi:hypothetical protein
MLTEELDINNLRAILIRTDREDGRALAFDDLQIQKRLV